jgi:hypothetical protein
VKKTKPVRAPKGPGNGKGTGHDRTPVKPRENGKPPVETPTPPPTGSGKPVR